MNVFDSCRFGIILLTSFAFSQINYSGLLMNKNIQAPACGHWASDGAVFERIPMSSDIAYHCVISVYPPNVSTRTGPIMAQQGHRGSLPKDRDINQRVSLHSLLNFFAAFILFARP